jgi:hypothetical protein
MGQGIEYGTLMSRIILLITEGYPSPRGIYPDRGMARPHPLNPTSSLFIRLGSLAMAKRRRLGHGKNFKADEEG